ncbi:hypothetical protein SprV_0301114500 [Sparganum proliferum]
MKAPIRLSTTRVHDLLFADDCSLSTTTEEDMQQSMDLLAAGWANFGPTTNTDKAVVMHHPSPNTQHCTPPRIPVDGHQLKTMDNFADLESTLSSGTRINDEVARQISKASQAFSRQQNSVRNRHGL